MDKFPAARVVAHKGDVPPERGMMFSLSKEMVAADYVVSYTKMGGILDTIRFLKCRWPIENIPDGEWCEILDAIKKLEEGSK